MIFDINQVLPGADYQISSLRENLEQNQMLAACVQRQPPHTHTHKYTSITKLKKQEKRA